MVTELELSALGAALSVMFSTSTSGAQATRGAPGREGGREREGERERGGGGGGGGRERERERERERGGGG